MWQVVMLFALKIVSLIAATAQTAGFIGLFAVEALQPYKWQLLVGGTLVLIASEGLAYFITKQMAASQPGSDTNAA